MIKKIIILLIVFTLFVSLVACSSPINKINVVEDQGDEIVDPELEDGQPEITIMLYKGDYDEYFDPRRKGFLTNYIKTFQDEFGVKVNLDIIGKVEGVTIGVDGGSITMISESSIDNYYKKLSTKLYLKDGPELIFYKYNPYGALIKQGAVIDVKDKIQNLDNIYNTLLRDEIYYIPIGIMYKCKVLNKKVLDELAIESPNLNWTEKDYLDIREKWLSRTPIRFFDTEYWTLINRLLANINIYDEKNNIINLNTPHVRKALRDIRDEIFSGKYILDSSYTYENYYNMLFELQSEEYRECFKIGSAIYDNYEHLEVAGHANALKTTEINNITNNYFGIVQPQFKDKKQYLYSFGFLINRNGKNIELAQEFINGLLSNEIQMQMYKDVRNYYPVSKEVEDDIKDIEAKEKIDERIKNLKEYALNQIKTGKCTLFIEENYRMKEINKKLYKDFAQFIFADETYSDEKMTKCLEQLEAKYNIWINE